MLRSIALPTDTIPFTLAVMILLRRITDNAVQAMRYAPNCHINVDFSHRKPKIPFSSKFAIYPIECVANLDIERCERPILGNETVRP